ncbi:MAG TPA: helix-turn-helix transcriptional regulator [Candidatus Cybelea sp.]|jgi:AraC-like DNA-binding protein/quercetin dioxygenase-like cupin family protein|nr:helix-turn-helix transcriptional regulator [Candidatus Cybelea sp.]
MMNVAYPNIDALATSGPKISEDGSPLSRSGLPTISVFACDYGPGETIARHRHDVGQLIYAPSGVMRVSERANNWTVSPREAVWVPPQTEHQIRMLGPVRLRSLYIEAGRWTPLPVDSAVFPVSALLRAVILRLMIAGGEYDADTSADRLSHIFFEELRLLTSAPAAAPLPAMGPLRALCIAFLEDPGSTYSVDQWAARFGMTRKGLARGFRRELKMTFGAWQRSVRVAEASKRLSAGQRVTQVALDLGYESLSAFTAMFHRTTGFPPSRIREREDGFYGLPKLQNHA